MPRRSRESRDTFRRSRTPGDAIAGRDERIPPARRSVLVRRARLRAACFSGVGRVSDSGEMPGTTPSIWITDTAAAVPERLLPRARPNGTFRTREQGRGQDGWPSGQAGDRDAELRELPTFVHALGLAQVTISISLGRQDPSRHSCQLLSIQRLWKNRSVGL